MLASSQLDPLKLTFCPRCDYSLTGLPETGICPECGDVYNQDFIVLRGKPVSSGKEPNGQKTPSLAQLFNYAGSILVLYLYLRLHVPLVLIMFMAAWYSNRWIRLLLNIFASNRKGEVLVWLSPAGIAEQSLVDPQSPAGRWLHYSNAITACCSVPSTAIWLPWILAPQWYTPAKMGIGGVVFLALLFPSYLIYLGRKPTPALRGSGCRPDLLPWRSYGSIEIQDLGDGAFQLWVRKLKSTTIRHQDVIKVECEAEASKKLQLFQLIRQWADPSVPVLLKPRGHIARAARKAGFTVRNIFPSKD
jgi:hypothetical protein